MTAVRPYPKFSSYTHDTPTQLNKNTIEVVNTLFPVPSPEDRSRLPSICIFWIRASAGNMTLIVADNFFMDFLNSCDLEQEVLPVVAGNSRENCSFELITAIHTDGYQVGTSPRFIAFELEPHRNRNYHPDPQALLVRIIRKEVQHGDILGYRIQAMPNTWTAPASNPHWQGVAFEQEDRLIYTWIHEPNPNALQRAKEDANRKIKTAQDQLQRIDNEIQRLKTTGQYQGARKTRLDQERSDIDTTLKEYQNELTCLTAESVNSASRTTLQCAVRMEVDDHEKVQWLERHAFQRLVGCIDGVLDTVSWENTKIQGEAIRSLSLCMLKNLKQKTTYLASLERKNQQFITNWGYFEREVLPKKEKEIAQTFEQFCQELGYVNPTGTDLTNLQGQWREELKKVFKWVNTNLRIADDQLKGITHSISTDEDIRIFSQHRLQMIKVLRAANAETYKLSLQLEQESKTRKLIYEAVRDRRSVHLVKRITGGGNVYFSVVNPPPNPEDRPDPNERWNEVHIPIMESTCALNRPPPPTPHTPLPPTSNQNNILPSRRWKWIIIGAVVLVGAWIVRQYFSCYFSSNKANRQL